MATITNTSKAVLNKLTGEEFTLPAGAVAKVNNFNLVLYGPSEVNAFNGKTMSGEVLGTIQLPTKSSMQKPIEFAKEMVEITGKLESIGNLENAYMACLAGSHVVKDPVTNKSKLVLSAVRFKEIFE